MSARSLTSASNMARRELCPGSAYAESLFPEEEDSDDSKEGTLLHYHDANPDKDRSALTSEQLEVLQKAESADNEIFDVLRRNERFPEDEPFEEGYEAELWFFRSLTKLFPGHCDRWRWYPRLKLLVIIDKKFGRKEVTSAEANVQLRSYAVMGQKRWAPEKVLVAINQPRLRFEDRVSMGEYTLDSLYAAKDHLLRVWDAAHNEDGTPREDAPRIADAQEQCRYCRAIAHCDAYKAKYKPLPELLGGGKEVFMGRLEAATDDEWALLFQAVAAAKIVEPLIKAEGIRRKEQGGLPDYELSDTGKTSVINDTPRAMRLLITYGLSEAEIMACAKLSKEDLAEKVKAREKLTVTAAKKRVTEILTPVLTITQKAPALKRVKKTALLE